MPKYPGAIGSLIPDPAPYNSPAALWPGDEKYLFGTAPTTPGTLQTPNDTNVLQETVAVGQSSIAVALAARPGGGAPAGIMVQLTFSGNPGASEFDIQDAAIDADGAYITPSSSTAYKISAFTALPSGQYTAYAELQPEGGRFVRLNCVAFANTATVKMAAKIVYV